MRITIKLPDELLKRAKLAAAERGVTLHDLIGTALGRELPAVPEAKARNRRVRLPIFASQQPGTLELTTGDLARAETDGDLRGGSQNQASGRASTSAGTG